MKATIDLEQFINVLIEAKKAIATANELEAKVAEAAQRKTALESQIAILKTESDNLSHAIKDHKRSVEEHCAREMANAEKVLTAYRATKEEEKKQLDALVAAAKQAANAEIARLQGETAAAKESASSAKQELAVLNEALDRARNDASKLARLANVARA